MHWNRTLAVALVTGVGSLVTMASAYASVAKHAHSQSIGAPNRGRLEHGVHLKTSSALRILPAVAPYDAEWATEELAEMVEQAAHDVRLHFADAILTVGQASKRAGGEIDRHHSHESGRDIDIAFYLQDAKQKPLLAGGYITIRNDGWSLDHHAHFDDARNFALLTSLVNSSHATITHIFVVHYLRARILSYAAKMNASPALIDRLASLMVQPAHVLPHDDHFHVRISCPRSSTSCMEWPYVVEKHPQKKEQPHHGRPTLQRARSSGRLVDDTNPLSHRRPAEGSLPQLPSIPDLHDSEGI
jgi:penicillin-insensitive murein endopeptidase